MNEQNLEEIEPDLLQAIDTGRAGGADLYPERKFKTNSWYS